MRIASTPYQPSSSPPATLPAAKAPAASAQAQGGDGLIRFSSQGLAVADELRVHYDAPSKRHRRAIDEYQSLDRMALKAQASELLGVDLYV
ncbi:hypothetical protein [Gallaecimonas xiamenensis]|uniref:Chromosome segregation ATPase n=1 Tax=Gallaecimonas xiamenensis 3-C-1 TaxID=745411 RepID=K2JET4_9GAMM|nr:hypothetical protein [Gallaecimonas xiamenensis]EKE69114.1 Chromosome segregation ATPase [Gallaecimonas xiamenensis 3-C-1]